MFRGKCSGMNVNPRTDNSMIRESKGSLSVASTIDGLVRGRKRLDDALQWLRDGRTTSAAVALAQEVHYLCEGALLSDEPQASESLLADVNERLQELERLLRRH